MIFIIVIWAYITFIGLGLGFGLQKMLGNTIKPPTSLVSLPILILLGLAILAGICTIFSFWVRIGEWVHIFIFVLVLGIYFFNYQAIFDYSKNYFSKISYYSWFILGISFVFAVLQSVPTSYGLDEGFYYITTIKWMSEYPAILGLGNLSTALAYNSNWHILTAFFSFSFLGWQNFNDLNGYLYVLLILYAIEGIEGLLQQKQIILNFTKAIFIAFSYFFFRPFIALTSADFAAGMLTWIVMLELLNQFYDNSENNLKIYVLIGLSCFAFTIKISAIWILIVPVIYIFKTAYELQKSRLFKLIALAFLIVMPYLTRNVITSGYVLYPINIIDIFDFDWKVPKETRLSGMVGYEYVIEPYLTGITHHEKYILNEQNQVVISHQRLSFGEWITNFVNNRNLYDFILAVFIILAGFIYLLVVILA
ncbi:MAG: hypothetical protein MUE85_02475 [Microscillaceae bacterium]|jgi:hypothetical protein|nr:hypothetical protein [Microscillaceae bacterium]